MYVVYFTAYCCKIGIWKQISTQNPIQVLSSTVRSTYNLQRSFQDDHRFVADDESTKLLRVTYTAFAINLTLSILTFRFVQEAPGDEEKKLRIKNFVGAIESANFYADRIQVPLMTKATISRFCGSLSVTQIDKTLYTLLHL